MLFAYSSIEVFSPFVSRWDGRCSSFFRAYLYDKISTRMRCRLGGLIRISMIEDLTILMTEHHSLVTEQRSCERFSPPKNVMVALLYPPDECEDNLIGHLVDISQSGLSFNYLSIDAVPISPSKSYIVSVLSPKVLMKPMQCKKVYEIESTGDSYPLRARKRVGMEFLKPLTRSELKMIFYE